jgi:hypothetical protein
VRWISIRNFALEFDSGSETGSPAGTPVIARIKDNYVSSPSASRVIARLKENNGIPCRKRLKSARKAEVSAWKFKEPSFFLACFNLRKVYPLVTVKISPFKGVAKGNQSTAQGINLRARSGSQLITNARKVCFLKDRSHSSFIRVYPWAETGQPV